MQEYSISEGLAQFHDAIDVVDTSTPANGDLISKAPKQVFENTMALRRELGIAEEKLSHVDDNANNYTHPTHDAHTSGLYKVMIDAEGHVAGAQAVRKEDITELGIPGQDTTYGPATPSAAGLMSADDKTKLDGIAAGANKTTAASGSGVNVSGAGAVSLAHQVIIAQDNSSPPTDHNALFVYLNEV